MEMLRDQMQNGAIQGLKISDEHTLLHQLFADDTGIFLKMDEQVFNSTMETLERFEMASGAKLNLGKTLVIPLNEDPVPQWLHTSACQVATTSDRYKYLGLLIGIDITEEELINDLKAKYEKKLTHWSTKLLSWPERLILAQTVLRSLPNYTLTAIGLSENGIKILERITADFVWGKNNTVRKKRPLIAWATFARRKLQGGLGWPDMKEMAQAFLLKNVTAILRRTEDDWTAIAKAIMHNRITTSTHTNEGQRTSISDLYTETGLQLHGAEATAINKLEALLPNDETDNIDWSELIYDREDEGQKLNQRWETLDTEQDWMKRWRLLWMGSSSTGAKTRFWRFLRKGYFTNHKAYDWNLDTGLCLRCDMEKETLAHAIWDCPRNLERKRWLSWLFFEEHQRTTSNITGETLIKLIDKSLQEHKANQAFFILLLTTWRTTWTERNAQQFEQTTKYMGVQQILAEAQQELYAFDNATRLSPAQEERLHTAIDTIEHWKSETSRWLLGCTTKIPRPPPSTNTIPLTNTTLHWNEEDMIRFDQEQSHSRQQSMRRNTRRLRSIRRTRTRTASDRSEPDSHASHVSYTPERSQHAGDHDSMIHFEDVDDLLRELLST
ncbi:hypothetical protein R1sor_012742 [Riccia sorocarpa]|uniref:Reverse transcriptase zinc-binding domain-containing protein n=1 Tax=Riccia sorocarpa TaxID=122646 RepID=A0ABD3I8Q1_9MARC